MVRHQPLQYYEPQLCLSCLTGICRLPLEARYQRSHDDTTPVSCAEAGPKGHEAGGGGGPQLCQLCCCGLLVLVFSFRTVGL